MSNARVMLAALNGASGKTVLTLGLLRFLTQQRIVVQPFKKGPDFIDPGWHYVACGKISRNLDSFFMAPEQIRGLLAQTAKNADLSIIEAAMGLFDGMDIKGSSSSAEIAKITQTPIILVVDAIKMTRTAAALVLGCQHFDPEVQIAGVILNRVRGSRHENLIRKSIESYCGIPVIGALPVDDRLLIPDRHLGLFSSEEVQEREQIVARIADVVAECIDLEAVVALAQKAAPLLQPLPESLLGSPPRFLPESPPQPLSPPPFQESLSVQPRIAVIRDAAFCFYYEENLLGLQEQGAELVFVNSLKDTALPADIHALYIGGGFPEMFAEQLQANECFRSSIREAIEADLPVYAECGGLVFLGRSLEYQGRSYEMVGVLQLDTIMQNQRQAHGYSVMESTGLLPWLNSGVTFIGHEHHHSKTLNLNPDTPMAFVNRRGQGINGKHDGICHRGVLAVNTHVNALASPLWAEKLVKQARSYQMNGQCKG